MKQMFSFLFAAAFMASCSKSKDDVAAPAPPPPAPKPSVAGFWKGTYDSNVPYAILFRADGSLRIYANKADTAVASKADGVYFFNAETKVLEARYNYIGNAQTYTISGFTAANHTQYSGEWAKDYTPSKGSFSVTKQ